jgi:hypothetical protein
VRHPRRFFRSSLLTVGALAAGTALALPASAAADAPVYAPAFGPPTSTVALNLGEKDVRVFHGLPTGEDDGVVRVDVDGEGRLRFAEFRPAVTGTVRTPACASSARPTTGPGAPRSCCSRAPAT